MLISGDPVGPAESVRSLLADPAITPAVAACGWRWWSQPQMGNLCSEAA